MMKKVKLGDIVQELGCLMDGYTSFLNTKTGEVVIISEEEFRAAEEYDDKLIQVFPNAEEEGIKLAIEVMEWSNLMNPVFNKLKLSQQDHEKKNRHE